jgi:PAS domain S-box-containing protein
MYTVLFVDDEPDLLGISKLYLERNGEFNVDTATSAKEAIGMLMERRYDAIISDYQMPGMDGIRFLKEVRTSGNTIPFILYTGRGREEIVIQALNEGADFYLQKGGDPKAQFAELTHKIQIAIEHHRAVDRIQSLNRLYLVLSATNKAIVHLRSKSEFLSEICRILVETGGFRMAWIGLADREHTTIRPVASAGHIDGYLDTIDIPTEDVSGDRGPTGTAYREGKYYFSNDIMNDPRMEPWRENTLKRGYLSNAAFPFALGTKNAGVLSLHAPVTGFFDEQIISLLDELAVDISFALKAIDEENDRKSAEESVRDHKRREADIINFLPDATCAIDRSGHIIAWNRGMEEMTGVPAAKMLGKGDFEYAIPFYGKRRQTLIDLVFESDEVIAKRYEHIIREKDILIADTTIPLPDGKTITLMGKASPLYNRHGEVIGAIESIRDITERKRAEDIIHESEQRYRNVVEDQTEFISRFLPDGTHVFVNDAYCRYFGLKRDGILGHRFRPKIPAEDQECVRQFFESLTPDHPVDVIEHRIIMPDGNIRWQRWSDRAIFDPSGTITEYQSVGLDITDWKQEEQALHENEQRLTSIYNTVGDVIFQLTVESGEQYRFTSVNSAFSRITGLLPGQVIGRKVNEVIPEPSLTLVLEKYRQAIEEKAIVRWEETTTYPRGQVTGEVSIAPIFDSIGICTHLIGSVHDITKRKRIEEALFNSRQMLQVVLDTIPQRVFWKDRNSVFLGCNKPLALDAGFSEPADIIGKTDYDHASSATADLYLADDRRVMETGQSKINYEERQVRADGSIAWLRTSKVPLRDKNGTIIGVLATYEDITDRKRTEEALRESEAKFRTLFNNANDAIYFLEVLPDDMPGKFLEVNSIMCSRLGYTREELLTMTVRDIVSDAHRQKILEINRQLAEKRFHIFYGEHKRKDGSVFPVEINSHRFTFSGKEIILAAARDITERRKVEEALRESEKKFRGIFDMVNDGIHIHEIEPDGNPGKFIEVNEVACRMLQYPHDELLEHGPLDFVTGYHSRPFNEIIGELSTAGHSIFETEHRRKDGTIVPVEINTHVVSLLGKRVMVSVVRDITERKNAEELVRESEMKYRMLFEGSRDAMMIVEPPAFRFTSCNAATLEMFGIKDETAFILLRPWDLSPETQADGQPSAKKALAMIDIAIRTGSHFFEWRHRRCNGETFPCTVLVSNMTIGGRTVLQATVRDITAIKQAEEALREANKKLNLLSSITRHDINNLLMVIRVYTQLAAAEKPEPVIADFLAKITSAIETIQHQIEFTRAYQELGMQAPAWFRLCEVIRNVRPPEIALVCTCEPCEIFADPMIAKVFFNLFDNAVKYGERVMTVTVACERAGDELVITFADNGIGIPPDKKQKIFEKGYGRNTGFGLFLAREILAITGITIHETGTHGEGARFEITVPKEVYRFP